MQWAQVASPRWLGYPVGNVASSYSGPSFRVRAKHRMFGARGQGNKICKQRDKPSTSSWLLIVVSEDF